MTNYQPFFSIIIPTYARPERLAACLQAIDRLNYPRERFEVIVVDDGSETPPDAEVAVFRGRLDITLLIQSHAGPAKARNTGAEQAKGTFLAFTDDDCKPAPDWLQKLAIRFSDMPDCVIGGCILNDIPDNPYSNASQMLIDYIYSYYNNNPYQSHFFTTNNFALASKLFHATGSFHTTFSLPGGEDREFCARWLHLGYQMVYASEVIVYHAHSLKFLTFWKQHSNYGRGAYKFHQIIAARQGLKRIKIEPLSFYLNIMSYPLSKAKGWRVFLILTLLFITQLANVCGFLMEKKDKTSF
jgi:glycosyltransferase involved in cell wall biosynthesis